MYTTNILSSLLYCTVTYRQISYESKLHAKLMINDGGTDGVVEQ